ncbi:citrate synthase family protein [Neptuniibacter marinus]|uniref:citrate/2-methylcitrate synthase n=1 Tax=Neptuniibacter marinus TaxID=1806670 RepID=UPI00082EA0E7|nr:citrate/2-methylcitrate synthase [Neptuniibacter marinus]
MSSNKTDPCWKHWDQHRNKITSNKGGWKIGDAVYNHGYSMMDDLIGQISWFQLLVLNTTGRLPDKNLATWLENCFSCLSWPDSRIWCNQIAALAGSVKTRPVAAISAGIQASDALLYGPGVITPCLKFIQQAREDKNQGQTLFELIQNRQGNNHSLPGFARPIAKGDERVTAMYRLSRELGFEIGPHESLALEISEYLTIQEGESINFGGYMAAFLADQGFSDPDLSRIMALWVSAGVHACYAEAADNTAGSYLPLQCQDIIYTGVAPRDLPSP